MRMLIIIAHLAGLTESNTLHALEALQYRLARLLSLH